MRRLQQQGQQRSKRPLPNQPVTWLGGLTPNQFMRDYWQKKPLLVRGAFPDFEPTVSIDDVLALCQDDRAESRLVRQTRAGWALHHGPFTAKQIPSNRSSRWTVLVQQVNTLMPEADLFLDAFRFIPEARLDDLMISVAGPDGGIGAHVDSYDVFLVQASGERRWEIAARFKPALLDGAPLKILRQFRAESSWNLAPGDLLYLPPNVAHRGTAIGKDCMTWSVGFRAPSPLDLADRVWANHWESRTQSPWSDPWLAATKSPGAIPEKLLTAMVKQVTEHFSGLSNQAAIAQSLAQSLSEPAANAVFEAPPRPDSLSRFLKKSGQFGLRLACATRLLYRGRDFFMNGEPLPLAGAEGSRKTPAGTGKKSQNVQDFLKELSDFRQLDCKACVSLPPALQDALYNVYRAGWIVYNLRVN